MTTPVRIAGEMFADSLSRCGGLLVQVPSDPLIHLIMGPPASGKTTLAKRRCEATPGVVRLSRGENGGALRDLLPRVRKALQAEQPVVLDNLFATTAGRRPFIDEARNRGVTVSCTVVELDIKQCMINACRRIIHACGRLLSPNEIARSRDPTVIPPVALFRYRKRFEPPSEGEGSSRSSLWPAVATSSQGQVR